MIRCLITDGSYASDPQVWLDRAKYWINEGVELLQIRERDLPVRDLAKLTRRVLGFPNPHNTKILVNDRADIAIACGAHGVHLRDNSPSPALFARTRLHSEPRLLPSGPPFIVTIACHKIPATTEELKLLEGADFVLLAPIFKPLSKSDQRPALGTAAIENFVRRCPTPVLALGGITPDNASACIKAGAAGIAGIKYFER